MTEERTYNNPGDCKKCGSTDATVGWVILKFAYGFMEAECNRCHYLWKVAAKDEVGGTT